VSEKKKRKRKPKEKERERGKSEKKSEEHAKGHFKKSKKEKSSSFLQLYQVFLTWKGMCIFDKKSSENNVIIEFL